MSPSREHIHPTARRAVQIAVVLALAGFAPGRLAAQLERAEPPGTLVIQKIPARDVVQTRADEARWRVGKLRLDPYLTLANLTYTNNVYDAPSTSDQISDLRGGAGLGLNSYLHLGSKTILSAFARADYIWWLEQEELRDLRGSYGATLYGLFNRLTLELGAARVERQQELSSELRAPVNLADERAISRLKVDASAALAVVATAETGRLRYETLEQTEVPQTRLDTLNRDTDRATLGLEYAFRNGAMLGLGGEYVEQAFLDDPAGRSNKSSGPLVTAGFIGQRSTFDLVLGLRRIEFEGRQETPDLEEPLGRVRVSWDLGTRSEAVIYGGRRLFASALQESSFSLSDQLGAALLRDLGTQVVGRLFVETQRDDYRDIATDSRLRAETTDTVGLTFDIRMSRRFRLLVGGNYGRRDSSDALRDANITSFLASLSFGDDLLPW